MEPKRDLAIVLKWAPFEERHRVVTALTEGHGRISALARNSIQSRRFGGALEPFAASEWLFVERKGAELFRVEEAQIRRSYVGVSSSFEKLSLASFFGELMIRLAPEREAAPELFKLHSNALAAVEDLAEDSKVTILALLNAYLAKVLQWSGSQPQIQSCLACSRDLEALDCSERVSVLIADAGWVCSKCRHSGVRHLGDQGFQNQSNAVSGRGMRDLWISLSAPIRKVPELLEGSESEQRALFQVLSLWMEFHVPGFQRSEFKTLRFLGLESTH